MDPLLLILGLGLLVKGADLLVSGSVSIAARFGIPSLVIGLTIVSFGTSLPELLVTFLSGIQGKADLAVANVVGSNIANICVVLAISALFRPLKVGASTLASEIPFSLAAALLVGFLANAALFYPHRELTICRLDGAVLLFFFFLFLLYVYGVSKGNEQPAEKPAGASSLKRAGIQIGIGILALYFGGEWVVRGAVGLAQWWGVDDALIGLTIVAVGTSSPELIASIVAAYRNEPALAVGNVVGSNIFNLLFVLGITAAIAELPFEVISNADLVMVIVASTLLILALASNRNREVKRWHGVVFLMIYVVYVVQAIQRV